MPRFLFALLVGFTCALSAASASADAASLSSLRGPAAAAADYRELSAEEREARFLGNVDDPNSVLPAGKDVEQTTEVISVSLSQLIAVIGMVLLVREANKYARGESGPVIGVGAQPVAMDA
jgi:hypothetical protein